MADSTPFPVTVSALLRIARDRKGMTRTKLAEFTGISPNTLVKYETEPDRGGKTPSLSRMMKIARVLEIDPLFDLLQLQYADLNESEVTFNFQDHFANDMESQNWSLGTKKIEGFTEDLNDLVNQIHTLHEKMERIENRTKKSGPDHEDPDRSQNSTTEPKAVDAASTNQIPDKKED